MAFPIRQYNIMDNIGAVGDARMAGGYDDYEDFGVGPVQPSPTYPTMGAISRIGQTPPMVDHAAPQDPNIAQLMQQFYTPETEATDAFNQLVRNAPQRNKPGIARRLAASAGALGAPKGKGLETAEQFMYAPFMRNTQDWMAKMDPNYKAASLENTRNANERQLAGNMAQYTMAERKQTETERKNRSEEEIRRKRAEVYDFKARNPNMRFDFSGPTVKAADPLTGKVYDTGLATGSMTDMDRINLQGEWGVARAREAGGQARETERVRQEGRESLADKRGWQVVQSSDGQAWAVNPQTRQLEPIQPPLGVTPPQGPLTRPGTPPRPSGAGGSGGNEALNVQRQRFNTAKQLADTIPGANKWIKFTSPTTFRIEQPGRFTSEADKKLYQDITSKIYGSGNSSAGGPGTGRGGGPGRSNLPPNQQKTPVKKEYSQSRNQTRITYSDGTTQIVNGRQ
jgi:hypothetical protein